MNTIMAVTSKRSKVKNNINSRTVFAYAGLFTLLVSVVSLGYVAPENTSSSNVTAGSQEPVSNTHAEAIVGEVMATSIAAQIADAADMSIAPSVANLAISTDIEVSTVITSDNSTASKPLFFQPSLQRQDILTYTVKQGDTLEAVAKQFGLSTDTIKWANKLTSDNLVPESTLQILPVNGVAYEVKSGDTLATIASKYAAEESMIISYNNLEVDGITDSKKIIIPNGTLPENERPGYVSRLTQYAGYGAGFAGSDTSWTIRRGTPMLAGNQYAIGNCTAYVFDRRAEIGKPVGGLWGNAVSWAAAAQNAGFTVNKVPSVGSIIQNGGGAGHVAIVEKLLPNGDLELSEMNASYKNGGWNIVSGRILPASAVSQYLYIH